MATKLRRWWPGVLLGITLPVWLGSCAVGKMDADEREGVKKLWVWTGQWVSAQTDD